MNKKLIRCPKCESQGKREILGEVDDMGAFSVLRFHQGSTKIISDNFKVQCGKCGELVFIRKK